jgi:hypothetical protein
MFYADLASHLFILAVVKGLFLWPTSELLAYQHNNDLHRPMTVRVTVNSQL